MNLWNTIKSIWSWETILDTGCVIHQRNKVTGKVVKFRYAGLGPVESTTGSPPNRGSVGKR